jgi:hypothetical protein
LRLSENELDFAVMQQMPQSVLGQPRVYRHIGGARGQNSEHGGDLLPALLHDHGHQGVWLGAVVPQPAPDPIGEAVQFSVGQSTDGRDHRRLLPPLRHLLDEQRMEQVIRYRRPGLVDHRPLLQLPHRHQLARRLGPGLLPRGLVVRQPLQKPAITVEHVVQQPVGEELLDRVPGHDESTGVLEDLGI